MLKNVIAPKANEIFPDQNQIRATRFVCLLKKNFNQNMF